MIVVNVVNVVWKNCLWMTWQREKRGRISSAPPHPSSSEVLIVVDMKMSRGKGEGLGGRKRGREGSVTRSRRMGS